jgi:hypothetical protein
MTEDGRSQPSSSGRTRPSHRLRAAQSARFFQIIPITMKRAISVRKATLMMATVRNTSVADTGFMSCLESFRLENVSVPNADGARCERRQHPRRPKAKSALAQKRRFELRPVTSGLPRSTDIVRPRPHVSSGQNGWVQCQRASGEPYRLRRCCQSSRRWRKHRSGKCDSQQARAKHDKTGNGHREKTVRSEFFAHGTPPTARKSDCQQDQLHTFAAIAGSHLPLRRGGESQVENIKRQSFDFGSATSIAATCHLQSTLPD